jgi:hypothetical protein
MSVSSISSGASPAYQSGIAGLFKQRKQDFKAMENAVQSGDLASAQQAVVAFQQDQLDIHTPHIARQGQIPQQNSQFKNDVSALITSIQSGDLTGAQQSLSAVQADMKASGMGHHHHHGGGGNGGDADDRGQANASTINSSSPLTGSSNSHGASADSSNSIQTLLNNLVNSAAQAAYTNTVGLQATSSILSSQA